MKTIQELIKKYDKRKSCKVYKLIIDRIKTEPVLWVAYTESTHSFYIGIENAKACAYIFTDIAYCDQFCDFMNQQYIFTAPKEISCGDRLDFFRKLYMSGIEAVIIDNGQTYLWTDLFDIIEKPDFSGVPKVSRPVMNPSFCRAANLFFQEYSVKRADRILELNMFRELVKAEFLIPADTEKLEIEQNGGGECTIKKNSCFGIPLIKNTEGKVFYPIFTDWYQLRLFDKNSKYNGFIKNYKEIWQMVEKADGVAINPFGFNFILDENMADIIDNAVKEENEKAASKKPIPKSGEAAVMVEHSIPGGTKVKLGSPAEYPEKMTKAICRAVKTNKNIHALYLLLMMTDKEQSYLIVADFEGDKDSVFGMIASAGMPYSNGKYLDFVRFDSEFGRSAVNDVKPFYKSI